MPNLGCYLARFLLISLSLAELVSAQDPICRRIQSSVSSASNVAYPGLFESQYKEDMSHWAGSSSQPSKCSVRPGSTKDLSKIIQILGTTKTPFAVKGGGHATNPGFSSTPGVLISMSRFSEVTYDAASQTVVVGAGLVWDDVYKALEPHKVSVAGGRFTGVGVGGFAVGGGYSYTSNQHGLTVDNILAYELIKPDGAIAQVTESSDQELFFGLKGGGNNFGIVTKFTMKTYHSDEVWGGSVYYPFNHVSEVNKAVAAFNAEIQVTYPKASILAVYHPSVDEIPGVAPIWEDLLKQPSLGGVAVVMFYDGPKPPSGIFDSFMKIPHVYTDVSTRDYVSVVQSFPSNATYGMRTAWDTVPIQHITPRVLEAVHNETEFWGRRYPATETVSFSFIQPFLPAHLSHNPSPLGTAWPPTRSTAYTPYLISYYWFDPALDSEMHHVVQQSAEQIRRVLIADSQPDPVAVNAPKYPNYATYDTPLERMYGENLGRLRELKRRVDPENVMGLAGGWKF